MIKFKVCIPHHGVIDAGLVEWLTKNNYKPILQRSYSVSKSRNVLMHRFLNECDDDWLFFLDYDMWPVNDNIFNFLETIDDNSKQCFFVPGVSTLMTWVFALNDKFTPLKEYIPDHKNYYLKPLSFFGGSGIFLHRNLIKILPPNMWRESSHKHTTSGEDVLFSSTLISHYGISAYLIYNSALHHSKNGFDLYTLIEI